MARSTVDAAAKNISQLIGQVGVRRVTSRYWKLSCRGSSWPQLRRAALDLAIALHIVLAFLTALVLANLTAASALSGLLPGWAAVLVLAAAWIVIGISLLVYALNRDDRVFDWRRMRKLGADAEQTIEARGHAREDAEHRMRQSLERLAEGFTEEAGVLVSSALAPAAGGVVSAGEHIIDGSTRSPTTWGRQYQGAA